MKQIFIFLLLLSSPLTADPWGKDADLVPQVKCTPPPVKKCSTPFFGPLAETLIGFHKSTISPADGPRSHHRPNSSQYMLDAIRKYGFFRGVPLGCDRLMRENDDPWVYPLITVENNQVFKYDPVK